MALKLILFAKIQKFPYPTKFYTIPCITASLHNKKLPSQRAREGEI